MSDFKITIISSVFFAFMQKTCRDYFAVLFMPFVKDCKTEEEKVLRCGKGAYGMFKLVYFVSATYWGWTVLKDQPFFPKSLGGSGDFARMWDNYPY